MANTPSSFRGTAWEKYEPVSASREAEMAVVYLALTDPVAAERILPIFQPNDFLYDDCRYVFCELQRMLADKLPMADKAALAEWFRRPQVISRMEARQLDWTDDSGNPHILGWICTLLVDGQWALVAHLNYYYTQLRTWRVTRALRRIAFDLAPTMDLEPGNPEQALVWLERRTAELRTLANTIPQDTHAKENTPQTKEAPPPSEQPPQATHHRLEYG